MIFLFFLISNRGFLWNWCFRSVMKLDYGWDGPSNYRKWGPYLSFGKQTSSEMWISWQSKFFTLKRWIEYGKTPECEHKIEEKTQPQFNHCIKLTELEEKTKYYYKISRPEDIQAEKRPLYSFKTGPAEKSREEFEFCVIGDMHIQDNNAKPLLDSLSMNAPQTDFIVTCGDCVTHGGIEERWNEYFYNFDQQPFASQIPVMNSTGNHDSDHEESYAHFVQTFHYPYENIEVGGYYSFVYANAVFIILDSDNAGQSVATQGVVSDKQYQWLEETLKKHALKDKWVFVFMHHQMYSTGDSGMMNLYELAYKDMFDEYRVDCVFFGHDHHFELFWTGRDTEWGGTQYFLVGNGGNGIDTFNQNPFRGTNGPNYLWKGRTYIYERDGILGGNVEGGVRNDENVKKYQVYGIMEQGFTKLKIKEDTCRLEMIGTENVPYFVCEFNRTGKDKKYHQPQLMHQG